MSDLIPTFTAFIVAMLSPSDEMETRLNEIGFETLTRTDTEVCMVLHGPDMKIPVDLTDYQKSVIKRREDFFAGVETQYGPKMLGLLDGVTVTMIRKDLNIPRGKKKPFGVKIDTSKYFKEISKCVTN